MNDYASLYRFLARTFLRPPDAEMLELAAELLDSPNLSTDAQQHTWLFEFNVYPYASVYLDPSGMLNAPWSGFVTGVYGALGLDVALDAGLAAPDHLSAQLEALATLLEREEGASELDAERARHAQKTLLTEHLLPWLPTFSFAVARLDNGVYGRLAKLTEDLACEHAVSLLGTERAPPFLMQGTDAQSSEEAEAGARSQLERFYTPARSGMYLSREDIIALGRKLELPVRFAERSFMLEQLALAAADAERLGNFFLKLDSMAELHMNELKSLQRVYPQLATIYSEQLRRLERTSLELADLSRSVTSDFE